MPFLDINVHHSISIPLTNPNLWAEPSLFIVFYIPQRNNYKRNTYLKVIVGFSWHFSTVAVLRNKYVAYFNFLIRKLRLTHAG